MTKSDQRWRTRSRANFLHITDKEGRHYRHACFRIRRGRLTTNLSSKSEITKNYRASNCHDSDEMFRARNSRHFNTPDVAVVPTATYVSHKSQPRSRAFNFE